MYCSNCGRQNDDGNKFCSNCGQSLKQETTQAVAQSDPQHSIFADTYPTRPNSNADLGFFIIALLILINVFLWIFWGFFTRSLISGNEILYKAIRVLSTFFSVAQFVVMFIFTKKQAFKIVIAIIGGIVLVYDLYYLLQTLTREY